MVAVEGQPDRVARAPVLLQPERAAVVVLLVQGQAQAVALFSLHGNRFAVQHDTQIAFAESLTTQAVGQFASGEKVAAALQILEAQRRFVRPRRARGQQQQARQEALSHGWRCR